MKRDQQPNGTKATSGAMKTDWGDVADWYDQLVGEFGSEYHREVVLPGVLRMLALQPGDRGLDIACGQGVLCRILAERGVEMTGVDAARPLIEAARQRGPESIRYEIAEAQEMGFLASGQFTGAACVLAIQNMHPLGPVFMEAARVLREWGRLVIVMMHPCFRGAGETSWGWDADPSVQYRRVDRYLLPRKTPIVTHPGKSPDKYTWSFHKPIQTYVKALRAAGLLVDAIEEWPSHKNSTSGPRAAAENVARKEIPLFLSIRSMKVTVPHSGG